MQLFGQTSRKNSSVKRARIGVVEGCMTYGEVIHNIVRVMQNTGKCHVVIAGSIKRTFESPKR